MVEPEAGRASYVAVAVLYDEYDNSPDQALAVLDEAAAAFGVSDAYLLKQRAMMAFRQQREGDAVVLFTRHWREKP